ncbi:unnamed protein product, partial [Urochloa humidicola]
LPTSNPCSSSSASTSQIRREKERGSQIRHGYSQIEPRRGSVERRRSTPPCRKGTPSPDPLPPLQLCRCRRWEPKAASAPVFHPCLCLARVAIAVLGFVRLAAAGIPRDSRAAWGQLTLAYNGRAD